MRRRFLIPAAAALAAAAATLSAFSPGSTGPAHTHGRFVQKALGQQEVREAVAGSYAYQPACWARFYPQPDRASWPRLSPEEYPDIFRFAPALEKGADHESHFVYNDRDRASGDQTGIWITDPKDHRPDYLDKYIRADQDLPAEGTTLRLGGWAGFSLAYYIAGKRLHCEQDLEVPAHQKVIYHAGDILTGWKSLSPALGTYSEGLEWTALWVSDYYFSYPDDWRDDPETLFADAYGLHRYAIDPSQVLDPKLLLTLAKPTPLRLAGAGLRVAKSLGNPLKVLRTKFWLSDREDDDDPPGVPNAPDDARYAAPLTWTGLFSASAGWTVEGQPDVGFGPGAVWARKGPSPRMRPIPRPTGRKRPRTGPSRWPCATPGDGSTPPGARRSAAAGGRTAVAIPMTIMPCPA